MDSAWSPPFLYSRATQGAAVRAHNSRNGVFVFTLEGVEYYAYPVHRTLIACSASCIVGDDFAWQTHPRSPAAERYFEGLLVLSGSGPRQRTFAQFSGMRTINEFYIGMKKLKQFGVAFVPWRDIQQ